MSTMAYALPTPARKFNDDELRRERRENNYGLYDEKTEASSWLDNVINRIDEWLSTVFSPIEKVPAWVVYLIAFALLAVLIVVMLGMSGNLPFGNAGHESADGNASEHENIHEIDFTKEIQEALKQGDYRKAVRLYYLLSLKLLSDKKLIDWQSHKTNREYIRELRATELRMKLEEVTFMFELVWYGEVEMDQTVFDEIFKEMQDLQKAIKATV
jgi:hypothetical protein